MMNTAVNISLIGILDYNYVVCVCVYLERPDIQELWDEKGNPQEPKCLFDKI